MKDEFFSKIYDRIKNQSTEATLGVLGVKSEPLRKYLSETLNSNTSKKGSILSDPVFEATYPWRQSENTFNDLKGFLQSSLIDSLDKPRDAKENGSIIELSKQALKKEFHPYEHQIKSWKTLLHEKPISIIVTSGTGSGKTECFMVPILNDLVKQYEENGQSLQGVQALFIYPLNALINSQRNRLLAWTQPFGKNVRFCLYNGNTPRKIPTQELKNLFVNEVHTREQLWDSVPPILITNPTMLEYMLIRQEDKPILDRSKGKLKYIVIDEAHTYIGSQAAELSLLLRRALKAFDVDSEDVRFIATSATIGNEPSAAQSLRQYLSDLAGLPIDKVEVIPGFRDVPEIPIPEKSLVNLPRDFGDFTSEEKKIFIYNNKLAWEIRNFLNPNKGAKTLTQINQHLIQLGYNVTKQETLKWLDVCSLPEIAKNGIHFLPLRGHMFHRVLNGLWACCNPKCPEKSNTQLDDPEWKFGKVFLDQRPTCESICGSPVYELTFCNDCNTAHLIAIERGGTLIQNLKEEIDEFEIDQEVLPEDDENNKLSGGINEVFISTHNFSDARQVFIDKNAVVQAENIGIKLFVHDDGICPSCGFSGQGQLSSARKAYLGMPFYNSSIVPTLLENTKTNDLEGLGKPFNGKSLITFTDSRQGTARIAVKMQQDAERNRLRGLVYHFVNINDPSTSAFQSKEEIEKLKNIPDWQNHRVLVDRIKFLENEINSIPSIPWNVMLSQLSQVKDIAIFMLKYYKRLDGTVFSRISNLANVLLIREFSRRPRRANSLETLGMVSIQYPQLEKIKTGPTIWLRSGFNFREWKDFLKIILDFFVRDGLFVEINRDFKNWLGGRYSPKSLLPPDAIGGDRFNVLWPQFRRERGSRQTRIIRYLAFILDYNLRLGLNDTEIDVINEILQNAWNDLTRNTGIITDNAGDGIFRLKLDKLSFSGIREAWYCPVTLRLLDATLKDITPFLPLDAKQGMYKCKKVRLPDFPDIYSQNPTERIDEIRNWQVTNQVVTELRGMGIWTNLSDIISEGGVFFRSEEHSAQQDHITLRKYEQEFQKGNINVLSCSTTMEMGVDIGGLSIVMNNNVPPHPSNYLQRAGRAGRRGESRSLSMTLCKNNPLDKEVFSKPEWPFKAKLRQPNITLQSKRIVQRHINAFLFGYFLKNELSDLRQSAIRLQNEWFFVETEVYQSICERFIKWMGTIQSDDEISSSIDKIRSQSILENVNKLDIFESSISTMEIIKTKWVEEHNRLISELSTASEIGAKDNSPYIRRIEREIRRMENEFLLSELVAGGFLPGYGFPTGIVPFNNLNINNFKRKSKEENKREDNNTRFRNLPTRNIAMALTEYAPGSEIVMDGKVYRSSGLTLNWQIPTHDSGINEDQKIRIAWRCRSCGNSGSSGAGFDKKCTDCGGDIEDRDKTEYIEPAGFAVNFYEEPSNNVSSTKHIPGREPWVIANGSLYPLPNEVLGFYKSDAQGQVFNHNSGLNGTGYGLCLACGYADSLTADGELPASFRNHNKLRGNTFEEGQGSKCNPLAYQIKWPIHLGSEEKTDIFELYLKNLHSGEFLAVSNDNLKLCWSLGIALRYGLSKCLGINYEEIGVVINKRRITKTNSPVYSIGLYDFYGGGSGFSTLAPFYLENMFQYAKELLQCPENCSSSCEKCLTQPGQYRISDYLDRYIALKYLNEEFLNLLALQDVDKLLGENSKFCPENLIHELNRSGKNHSEKLDIFLNGPNEEWDLGNTNWKQRLLGYMNSFEHIYLHLHKKQYELINEIDKLSLYGLSSISPKIRISIIDEIQNPARGFIVVRASNNKGETISYASPNIQASIPGESWLNTDGYLLVKSSDPITLSSSLVDNTDLLPISSDNNVKLDVKEAMNGTIEKFGEKFWDILNLNSEYIGKHLKEHELKTIEYSDRYLQTPLSMLLLKSIVNNIPSNISPDLRIKIRSIVSFESDYSKARALFKSWVKEEENERQTLMERLFSNEYEYIADIILYENSKELSHSRKLKLTFKDKSCVEFYFDQGMGFWKLNSFAKYPFDKVVDDQLVWITQYGYSVSVKNDIDYPTFIFVKLIE